MSRFVKKQLFSMVDLLDKANKTLEKNLLKKKIDQEELTKLLSDCQESALSMGNLLEELYGEGHEVVGELEAYCETLYQMALSLLNPLARRELLSQLNRHIKRLRKGVGEKVSNKLEVVFLPYKVSMWDSLESIWQAADADENCDAYVIPIPYYDRNPDGSFKEMHYEGDQYPDYVPVTDYGSYRFETRMPDIIFIHNPYDNYNYVTSVHPYFYSQNLKGLSDLLVYVPYFSTAGGMSEGQGKCISYYYVDYIMVQAEKFRGFYDPSLPQEKLQPLGSPKFDRVVRICQNPPEAPGEWKEQMVGKKVYFYNTSLGGMLGNTQAFLKKMEYVFKCFEGREDACLLWRPHPLLESTFESVRARYKPVFDELKAYFIRNKLGIYDDTPEITNTIALCDAYIGDAGTSVTSLFGIVGKPMFILNNDIHSQPGKDDWRGQVVNGFSLTEKDAWMITQGNRLYHAGRGGDRYSFTFCCDLSHYAYGGYYAWVVELNGKTYVCPSSGQDILVLDPFDKEPGSGQTGAEEECKKECKNEGKRFISRRIPLENPIEQSGAFRTVAVFGNYLFLIPNQYPAIVRYDTATGEIQYWEGSQEVACSTKREERQLGGIGVWKEYLFLASPVDNRILKVHMETGESEVLTVGSEDNTWGCCGMAGDGQEFWLLPYEGKVITRWNPKTGETREYRDMPEGLACTHPSRGYACEGMPFGSAAFYGDSVVFSPNWGNMFVRLDKISGKIEEWKPPFEMPREPKSDYYPYWGKGYFIYPHYIPPLPPTEEIYIDSQVYQFFSSLDKTLYQVDFVENTYEEIPIEFDLEEVRRHEPGFREDSQWLMYACQENAFNSLTDFLDGRITGDPFDKERQIQAFSEIAANPDGSSGEKIYQFVKGKL